MFADDTYNVIGISRKVMPKKLQCFDVFLDSALFFIMIIRWSIWYSISFPIWCSIQFSPTSRLPPPGPQPFRSSSESRDLLLSIFIIMDFEERFWKKSPSISIVSWNGTFWGRFCSWENLPQNRAFGKWSAGPVYTTETWPPSRRRAVIAEAREAWI